MGLATKFAALLISLMFLTATAQCTSVCVQPEAAAKHVPPCHQKHVSCAKPLLTADKIMTPDAPISSLVFLPFTFAPIYSAPELQAADVVSIQLLVSAATTVLLI